MAAGRVAHFLDLRGPAMSIDTSCSSSLVAIHSAVQRNAHAGGQRSDGLLLCHASIEVRLIPLLRGSGNAVRITNHGSDHTQAGDEEEESLVLSQRSEESAHMWPDEERAHVDVHRIACHRTARLR